MKEMYGDLVQQLVVAATRLSEEVRGGQGGEGGREGRGGGREGGREGGKREGEGKGGREKGREGEGKGRREGMGGIWEGWERWEVEEDTHTPTDRWGCWKRMCWWVRPGEREATALRKVRQT